MWDIFVIYLHIGYYQMIFDEMQAYLGLLFVLYYSSLDNTLRKFSIGWEKKKNIWNKDMSFGTGF
jgi:hypothetical protein